MLDIKKIRQNPEEMQSALAARGAQADLKQLLNQDAQRRQLLAQSEEWKTKHNAAGKKIGAAKKKGASAAELSAITEEMRRIADQIVLLDTQIQTLDAQMEAALLALPNLPHSSVPAESRELRPLSETRIFLWEPKTHQELGDDLGVMRQLADGTSAPCGAGAQLKRALVNFCLDTLAAQAYEEQSALLLPTSETFPLQNTVLDASALPVKLCSNASQSVNACEIIEPSQGDQALEGMIRRFEHLLDCLEIPTRTVACGANELPFSAASSFSIQVWMPSLGRTIEAARISSHETFLARRNALRFRENAKAKPQHPHTLAATLDLTPVLFAIWENHQNEDGTIGVPAVLRSWLKQEQLGPNKGFSKFS